MSDQQHSAITIAAGLSLSIAALVTAQAARANPLVDLNTTTKLELNQSSAQPVTLTLPAGTSLPDNTVQALTSRLESLASHISAANTRDAEVHTLLKHCEQWRVKTEDRISCRNGDLYAYWENMERKQTTPDRAHARQLARTVRNTAVDVNNPDGSIRWDFRQLHSPFLLDSLADWITEHTSLTTFALSSNNNAVYRSQDQQWPVAVATTDTRYTVHLQNAAVSTLIPWQHSRKIDGKSYQGIIDGGSGWPEQVNAAISIDQTAVSAKAQVLLAASLSSQNLFDTIGTDTQIMLTSAQGHTRFSSALESLVQQNSDQQTTFTPLNIALEIPDIDASPYRRPYVSVWITDNKRKPVRNLVLMGERQRWMKSLRVWWRRIGRGNESLIDGFSGATKKPGTYHIEWDGRDDYGQPVTATDLVLHIEASREHGGRSYEKIPLTMNQLTLPIERQGKKELGLIRIDALSTNQTAAVTTTKQ